MFEKEESGRCRSWVSNGSDTVARWWKFLLNYILSWTWLESGLTKQGWNQSRVNKISWKSPKFEQLLHDHYFKSFFLHSVAMRPNFFLLFSRGILAKSWHTLCLGLACCLPVLLWRLSSYQLTAVSGITQHWNLAAVHLISCQILLICQFVPVGEREPFWYLYNLFMT
jgi:hypothetical protein